MAGIYIHIPFCFTQCGYCDFFKTTKLDKIEPFVESLLTEISLRAPEFNHKISTLYIGGGTPSLLKRDVYEKLLNHLKNYFIFIDNFEWTIEVNPDDITEEYLKSLFKIGVNRLSIGIQSFNDEDLRQMGRRHNAEQAINAIKIAQKVGFSNISIDLIYGLPWSNDIEFEKNIEIINSLKVQHISAYHLIFEEGTTFYSLLKKGKMQEMNDEQSLNQFITLGDKLKNGGFIQYELSNFCVPNFESKHNSSYWSGEPYIGFGPGSHSFYNNKRKWIKGNLELYNAQKFNEIIEEENLSIIDKFNEYIMLALRTAKGVDLVFLQNNYQNYFKNISLKSQKWIDDDDLIIDNNFLKCTSKGWFLSDAIIEDFFEID